MINNNIKFLYKQKVTKRQINIDAVNLQSIDMTDITTYLNEYLNQIEPTKMSHKAMPGQALQNYLKE